MGIKAIETIYKGHRFRSRLEARWAVFFDSINLQYEYETQGFESDDGEKYLPDFYLPDEDMFIEVKPLRDGFCEEITKAIKIICIGLQKPLLVLTCIPPQSKYGSVWWHTAVGYNTISCRTIVQRVFFCTLDNKGVVHGRDFYEGAMCEDPLNELRLHNMNIFDAKHAYETRGDIFSVFDSFDDPIVEEAYTKARQARFEHGDKPIINN